MVPVDCEDRTKWLRNNLQTLRVAALWPYGPNVDFPVILTPGERIHFVDAYVFAPESAVIRTISAIDSSRHFYLAVFNSTTKSWDVYTGIAQWSAPDPVKSGYQCTAFALTPVTDGIIRFKYQSKADKTGPLPDDYEFFRSVPFLKAIHREAVCPLLNSMTYLHVKAGDQIVTQGHEGDACYIVQSGRCKVIIEKPDRCHVVSRIGKREFIGEMALLTGEIRSAHVIAENDVELWAISQKMFQNLIEVYPEVGTFLTEIMVERFASRTLTADRTIGKYMITDIIGRGGYAIVYKGFHMDLNRPVAIKMLNHDMALNKEFLENFRKEARTIAGLNNENIIKVYDIEERYRTIFIIMELLEGQTLRQLLDTTGPLSISDAVDIILKVCSGLKYAHAQGLVHQDVKPGNIFILPDGGVKILDFGLACPCGSENFLTGTPFYMSPEQVECLPVDQRSDIYSLGHTAFEMVAGRRLFEEENAFKAMNLHVEQAIPDPADVLQDIPDVFREFILKACTQNPDGRYRNIAEASETLTQFAHKLGIALGNTGVPLKKMSTMFLFYREDQELVLKKLMEEFSDKVKAQGIILKAADFENI